MNKDKNIKQESSEKAQNNSQGSLFKNICIWFYKLRSVVLAIPVAFAAIILAIQNFAKLPAEVGLCIPSMGAEGMAVELISISRSVAVFCPLLITAACLLLMFCSRRVVYPWLISVFSLVLPLFVYFTSIFPG